MTYTIDTDGIHLGTPWQDADHLNVRTQDGTTNFHAEAKCANVPTPAECSPIMVNAATNIGNDFIAWGDLGIDASACIEWVQFSRANYHYGENGEAALCLTVEEPPTEEEPPVTEPPVTEPPVTNPPPLDCPEGKVPGWLDEHGNPQGCVDNNPTPLEPKPEQPTPDNPQVVPEQPAIEVPAAIETATAQPVAQHDELALTGAGDMLGVGLGAVVLLAAGVALMKRAARRA